MLGKKNKKGSGEEGAVESADEITIDSDELPGEELVAVNGVDDDAAIYESSKPAEDGSDPSSSLIEVDPELITRLEAEAKENYDKYLRAVAELENYKKRAIKDRSDLLKYAGEGLARDLLEVLDDLDRAIQHTEDTEQFIAGVKLIRDRLISVFDKHGIKGESAVNKLFDPNTHQALASVPTAEIEPNTIIEEFKKAYFYKDKLLRPGQAVVSAPVDPPQQ